VTLVHSKLNGGASLTNNDSGTYGVKLVANTIYVGLSSAQNKIGVFDFGAFTPGIAKDYTASTTANVISTAADAVLGVRDANLNATGHLVNGTFALPQPL
jgi:hypothetical protein